MVLCISSLIQDVCYIVGLDTYPVHAKLIQSRLILWDPMDCSLPGSSLHGDSPGKNTGVGCHAHPLPGDLPNPGITPTSLMSPASVGGFFTTSTTWEAQNLIRCCLLINQEQELDETNLTGFCWERIMV